MAEPSVADAALLQMVATMLEPVVVDDDTLAVDTIGEVGPGGHFFGTAHTQARFRDAFYRPFVSDWRNYEAWQEGGSPTADQRTHSLADRFLELTGALQARRGAAAGCGAAPVCGGAAALSIIDSAYNTVRGNIAEKSAYEAPIPIAPTIIAIIASRFMARPPVEKKTWLPTTPNAVA